MLTRTRSKARWPARNASTRSTPPCQDEAPVRWGVCTVDAGLVPAVVHPWACAATGRGALSSCLLMRVSGQLWVQEGWLWRCGQAAVGVSPVTWCQVVNRVVISWRYWAAVSRWRRGRRCGDIRLNTDRNRCACPGEVNFFIARSRCRVGWWEFSARLFRYLDRRCSTLGISRRWATPWRCQVVCW
jgi:hypothetical protein